ncbi:hypothetical protein JAAARDRAFT_35165 [Jaapia argillacea MUCL 33604]|uniref:Fe2OG dioxygenase domain-containing protein n=1 Tax=Jaapia argillacea MUCL 33604 TaxID=933084 RepID=A0A067Q4F4_9AGAM|nr:hypothetical protein JAAARDRAFT_35165 [Jaapia argillacea MUCL 33604]
MELTRTGTPIVEMASADSGRKLSRKQTRHSPAVQQGDHPNGSYDRGDVEACTAAVTATTLPMEVLASDPLPGIHSSRRHTSPQISSTRLNLRNENWPSGSHQPVDGGTQLDDLHPSKNVRIGSPKPSAVHTHPPRPVTDPTSDYPVTSPQVAPRLTSAIHPVPRDLQVQNENLEGQDHLPAPEPTIGTRPSFPGTPPMWAKSRQEVCETLDYFRSYQGGVYFADNIAKGYLLSAFSSANDIFHRQGKLIISHGGGKSAALHSKDGKMVAELAEDQRADDKSVRALLNNFRTNRPLVLLADDKYQLFPYDLQSTGIAYIVLGYYVISHAWAEKHPAENNRGEAIRYKFAFEWCDSQREPWWIPDVGIVPPRGPSTPSVCKPESSRLRSIPAKVNSIQRKDRSLYSQTSTCKTCEIVSVVVYAQGWICLNPACSSFWKLENGYAPPDNLSYSPEFLRTASLPELPELAPLFPSLPALKVHDGVVTSESFSKGWHCVRCGRLSSRFKWEHWECAHCGNVHKVRGRVRQPNELWIAPSNKFVQHWVAENSGITCGRWRMFDIGPVRGSCRSLILPGGIGRIHHIVPHPQSNGEADQVFREYQEQAADGSLGFRRWPIRSHKCRGQLLASYFSHNAGAPYHYVGGTGSTVSFDSAPSAVLNARKLIQDRASAALMQNIGFNEVLSASYMEGQKMAFHGDDERGLGPVIAGLSLGSPALMHFRPHLQTKSKKGERKIVLSVVLRHGDVLIMEGRQVQECYEHTVIPFDFRISATARWIHEQALQVTPVAQQ